MTSERTLYWIAVALMAVLVGNHFVQKYDRCFADLLSLTIQRLSDQAGDGLAMVERVLARTPSVVPPQLVIPPVEARFASFQAKIARRQAACVRLEAERARIMAIEQIDQIRARGLCPRQGIRIAIPKYPVTSAGAI